MPFLDLLGRPITMTKESPVFSPPPAPPGFGWQCQAMVKRVGPDVVTRQIDLAPGATPVLSGLGAKEAGATQFALPQDAPGEAPPNWAERVFGVSISGRDIQGGKGATVSAPPSTIAFSLVGAAIGASMSLGEKQSPVVGGLKWGVISFVIIQSLRAAGKYGF